MEILPATRLQAAKQAFSTRRVPIAAMKTIEKHPSIITSGDIVLAKVISLGSHKRIELPTGRKATLLPGDEIILSFGNRYAPDQYEAYIPNTLEPCHMVAAGGVAAKAVTWHSRLSGPTQIEPIGIVCNSEGKAINLKDYAIAPQNSDLPDLTFGVFGTSMNAGKTTTAAALVKSFSEAGYNVGAAKVTGTGAGGDLWLMRDYGALEALDFTDAGFPTTFQTDPNELIHGTRTLLCELKARQCEIAILEIADGLYQNETAALAKSDDFRSLLNGTFFAAGDAMGAAAGALHLEALGHQLCGVSGAMTRSPLAIREVQTAITTPVYTLDDMVNPNNTSKWVAESIERQLTVAV